MAVDQRVLQQVQRQHCQLLILSAIGGDFAAFAKQNEVVHAVPMLDEVQTLLDLAAQSLRVQTLACTPSPHPFSSTPGVCLVAVAFREFGKFPRIRNDPLLETVGPLAGDVTHPQESQDFRLSGPFVMRLAQGLLCSMAQQRRERILA
jgi:hypothetical protein